MRSHCVVLVATLLCFVVISAKPSLPLPAPTPPPPTIYRNTLHGYIECEAGVVSDIVKGTKHVKLWDPFRKQMEALAKTAKACTTKKDVKEVKKCEIGLKPKLVDIMSKFAPKLKKINPEFQFVLTFLIVQRCYPIKPNDIMQ